MNKWIRLTSCIALCMVLAVSCRQLYTTSFATAVARDKIAIPTSLSVSSLVDLASGSEGSDTAVAKELLAVLAGKSQPEIAALSPEDQATILSLATTAAVNFTSLNTALESYVPGTTSNEALLTSLLGAFDSSVNLTSVQTILSDTEALASAPADSIILASAVILADIAADLDPTTLMTIMADPAPIDYLTATPTQIIQIDILRNVATVLGTRDTSSVTFGGFNLTDLLGAP